MNVLFFILIFVATHVILFFNRDAVNCRYVSGSWQYVLFHRPGLV